MPATTSSVWGLGDSNGCEAAFTPDQEKSSTHRIFGVSDHTKSATEWEVLRDFPKVKRSFQFTFADFVQWLAPNSLCYLLIEEDNLTIGDPLSLQLGLSANVGFCQCSGRELFTPWMPRAWLTWFWVFCIIGLRAFWKRHKVKTNFIRLQSCHQFCIHLQRVIWAAPHVDIFSDHGEEDLPVSFQKLL